MNDLSIRGWGLGVLIYPLGLVKKKLTLVRFFSFLFIFSTLDSLYAAKFPEGLYLRLETSKGDITCRLFTDQAPMAVRNFGMLAQGVTTWKDPLTNQDTQRPIFNGTTFYKVVPDELIEGGDPTGSGTGGPGFEFEDEIHANLTFDQPGRLALAHGEGQGNGSRFFITLKPMKELNGRYTIFGEVIEGLKIARKISRVDSDQNNRPLKAPIIKKAEIFRVEPVPSK